MPTTFKSAMESGDAIKWKEACDSEIESLHKNETWILVPLPKGRKAISNRWVFRVKENQAGEIERFKSRLVAKGFLCWQDDSSTSCGIPVDTGMTITQWDRNHSCDYGTPITGR
ncbi:unnamed protein product [Phytophthora fragariaefolia]|uniref:Unnamed protein product n=1 Tax=Phytophthora fragariaefolia TaxID=1490495 RepID=A0A9W6YMH5_9STRA|nr:unnamed protein product [Phytophthora fragariaefolia]